MARVRRLRVALVLAAALLASGPGTAQANDARIVEQERFSERVIELTIETPAFAEPTKVHVNLPVGYDANRKRRWPVTYFTAGTMNNYDTFNTFVDGEALSADYPSIIVSPDGNSGYWSDWFNSGEFGPPMYETYVIEQLIPLIDERFRTVPERSHRLVFGVSMGGYGALMFAARHPDLFSAASSISGAVDSNLPANANVLSISSTFDGAPADAIYGPRNRQEVRWHGHNPTDLADNLRTVEVQVRTANGAPNPSIGEGEEPADSVSCIVEKGVHMASVNLHARLRTLRVPHEWRDYGAGCHTKPNFIRQILHTFDSFERVLADPPADPRAFDYRSIEPRFDVWGWRVHADPERALEFMGMRNVSRRGLTLVGSGETTVRTPPLFRGLRAVDALSGGEKQALRPDRRGRLEFPVDLGPPHPDQQYTVPSRAAGDGRKGYFERRRVTFAPHAALELGPLRERRGRLRVCLRVRGAAIERGRITVQAGGGTVAAKRDVSARPGKRHCAWLKGDAPETSRYTVRAVARDTFGHRITAKRRARAR